MIVWKGWGIMALIIPLLCSLAVGTALDAYHGENFYQSSVWAMPAVLAVSALFVYLFGARVNNKPGRLLIDPENNERVELKQIHSMFWIPLQYWSVIIVVISLWMYAANMGFIYSH